MRMLFTTVAMAAVTIACSSPCSAELLVEAVSKDRAEKLGMEFRFKPGSGDTVWIEFEFTTDTELKMFREPDRRNRVELKVYGENKQFLAMARLREERSKDGEVTVRFATTRANIDKLTLMLVAYGGGQLGGEAWELKVGRFYKAKPTASRVERKPTPKSKK